MSRVAVVTGASGLVGRALVRRLADASFTVVAHARTAQSLDDDLRAVADWCVWGDLSGPGADERCSALIGEVVAEFSTVDVLVNNAASQESGSFHELSDADWFAMLDATLMTAVRMTRACVPHMPAGGAVINVSSVEASSPFPGHAHYAAAKAALESLTRSLAVEMGPRIRVNAVAPGLVDRPDLAREWPDGVAAWTRGAALGRTVSAGEVADAIAWLARASGVTGAVVPVDAGWSASRPSH